MATDKKKKPAPRAAIAQYAAEIWDAKPCPV